MSEINLTAYKNNPDMARAYVDGNGIKGAFVWRNDSRDYEVLEGNPEELTGFVAGRFERKRDADKLAAEINEIIKGLK